MDDNTVELKLLPVCECGYIFKELTVTESINVGISTFFPCHCPNCKKVIESVSLSHNFDGGTRVFN